MPRSPSKALASTHASKNTRRVFASPRAHAAFVRFHAGARNAAMNSMARMPMSFTPMQAPLGYGSKLNHHWTPCFHLPGFHLGYIFLTHSRLRKRTPKPPSEIEGWGFGFLGSAKFGFGLGGGFDFVGPSRGWKKSASFKITGLSPFDVFPGGPDGPGL